MKNNIDYSYFFIQTPNYNCITYIFIFLVLNNLHLCLINKYKHINILGIKQESCQYFEKISSILLSLDLQTEGKSQVGSYKHFIFYGVYLEVAVVFKEVNTSHTLIVAGLLPLPPHQAREASPSSSPGYFSRHLRFHSGY